MSLSAPGTAAPTLVSIAAPATLPSGIKNVTTAGTRVALAASTPCREVILAAKVANTGIIYVGDTAVSSSVYGVALYPGQSVRIKIANLLTINLDCSVSGEGVSFLASA